MHTESARMKKYINLLSSVFYGICATLLVYFTFEVGFGRAALFALLAVAVQVFAWKLYAYRTRIGYALSFIPASLSLFYNCFGGVQLLIASGATLLALVLFNLRQWFVTREATQNWLASAIYVFILALTAAIII